MTLKRYYFILLLIGLISVFIYPVLVNAYTALTDNVSVCRYDRPNCPVSLSMPISLPSAGLYEIYGDVRRGTHNDECQAHEDFRLYIDGKFYATSWDDDPCEPGTTDIQKRENYPSIVLSAGNHIIKVVHVGYTNLSLPTAESVSVQLFLNHVATPPDCAMSMNPSSIASGEDARLSWSSSNTTSVSINQGIGSVFTNGFKMVSPSSDTTYTGIFTGPGGTKTCSATLKVNSPPPPTCSMSLSPVSISGGESSILSWSSSNTTSASLTANNQKIQSIPTNGSDSVSPSSNTIYTGTFTGPGGTKTCSAILSVNTSPNAPTCSMSVNPSSINQGEDSVLSWSSSNVTTVSIDRGIGSVPVTGSTDIFPSSNTTYTGTFTGPEGTITCHASIDVIPTNPEDPVCSMNISDNSINKGESAVLSWTSKNVNSASIDQGIGNVSPNDSIEVVPDINTTYTGTFTGPEGAISCNVFVEVIDNPEVPSCSMRVSPSSLSPGQSATLYWYSNKVSTTTIDHGIGVVNNNGSIAVRPGGDTTYRGTFEAENETLFCSAKVTLGGGGDNPPNVFLSSDPQKTEPSFVYLSQIPYTGIPESVKYFFRIIFFGGLLYVYYRVDGRKWKTNV